MIDAHVYVSGSGSPEIRVLGLDQAAGTLTPLHTLEAGPGSGYLAFSRDGRFVYGINRLPARVVAWAREEDGRLRRINAVEVEGAAGTTHLSVHPGGQLVLAAHFLSGHVSVHPLNADGSVGRAVDLQVTGGEAHQTVCTSDGRFLLVPCRSGNVVCQFLVDPATGKLARNAPFTVPAMPGAGPRHLALHPSQRFAFLLNELDGTMTSYAVDQGQLFQAETVSSVPPGFVEQAAAHIEVHPSGRFVYASNRQHGSLAIWSFDAGTRRLQARGYETAGGRIKVPRDFTLAAGGALLLAANQADGLITVFRVGDDGDLHLASTAAAQPGATFIGVIRR